MKSFSIGEAVSYGWKTMLKNFWLFLGILVLLIVIVAVAYGIIAIPMIVAFSTGVMRQAVMRQAAMHHSASFAPTFPMSPMSPTSPAFPTFPMSPRFPMSPLSPIFPFRMMSFFYLFGIAFTALTLWLKAGLVRTVLNLYNDQKAAVTDIFTGGKYFLHFVILFCLLIGAYYILMMIFMPFIFLFIGPRGPSIAIVIPIIIVLIVMIYLGLRIQFVYYIIIDKDLKLVDTLQAVAATWQITRHQVLKLFWFFWVLFGIEILGVICLLIGTLFTTPTLIMAHVHVYKQLDNNFHAALAKAQQPDLQTAGDGPEIAS